MMKNKFSKFQVESIMESMGGMQRAAVPDFFYTRLKAKMQPAEAKQKFFLLRPAFITATLAVLLIVNVVSLFTIDMNPKVHIVISPQRPVQQQAPATIESFATAYNMNSGSVYE